MTFIWLIVWLLCDTPALQTHPWNNWLIGLAVCAVIDVLSALSAGE